MGKVFRLTNQLNLLLPSFGLSVIVIANTSGPARRAGITPSPYTKHVLIWSTKLYLYVIYQDQSYFSYGTFLFIYLFIYYFIFLSYACVLFLAS